MPWRDLAVAGELVDEGVGGARLAFDADGCEVLKGVGWVGLAFGGDGGEVLEADADVGLAWF
jgi:hypothetical protein